MNPLQRHLLVQQSHVLCVRIVFAVGQVCQMEEAESAQSVGDGNEDHIGILFGEIGTIKQFYARSACHKSATVNPHHNRLLGCGIVSLPNVQIQAVFSLMVGDREILNSETGKMIGLIDAVVGSEVYRCLPAQFADRLFVNEGDTLVSDDILRLCADEGSVNTLDS